MRVVLDANILISDPWLGGADFRWLSAVVAFSNWTLHVPRLAIDEAVNKYREKLIGADFALAKAEQELAKLLGQPAAASTRPQRTGEVSKYKAHLLSELGDMGARLMPYPKTSHREMVKRALERRKPFDEKGAGYRDALIWQSVLSLVDGKHLVAFVTNDSGDFFGRDGRAHPDLAQDFARHETAAQPRFYRTLRMFLEAEVKSHFAELATLKDQLNADGRAGAIDVKAVVAGHLMPGAGRLSLDPRPLNPDAIRARILLVDSVARIRVEDVRRLSVHEVMVDLVADCQVVLEFTWEQEGLLGWEAGDDLSYESALLAVSASFAVDQRDGSVTAVEVREASPAAS